MKYLRESPGKSLLVAVSVLMWLLIMILLNAIGYQKTWDLWKVPTWNITFLDFRLIPGSAESFAHGYEPSVDNPYDFTQRIFNYPAFWRLFFYTGITEADTIWVSVSMIVLFFMGAFFFPEKLSIPGALGMLVILFSPASMLLYERGNVDLFVFFVCSMAVFATSYSAYLATVLILFAAIMKLFPILGLSALLKEPKKKFLWLSAFSVFVLFVYMIATWRSVVASWTLTMRGEGISYGSNVLVTRYTEPMTIFISHWLSPHRTHLLLQYGPLLVALFLLFFVVMLAIVNTKTGETITERNLAAFRMGAAIYVGTFLLGNNWDYRLAFLVLVIPQLVEWTRSSNKTDRILSWLNLILVVLSCWHLRIVEIPLTTLFRSSTASKEFWIVLDELFNWMLFLSLAYLLSASCPDWIRQFFQTLSHPDKWIRIQRRPIL